MNITVDKNYGCDIDGNRGTTQVFYDLTPDDYDWIYEHIAYDFDPNIDIYTLWYYDDERDIEVEIDVDIEDWLSPEEIEELTMEYRKLC